RVSTRGFEREPVEMGGVLSKVLQSLGPAVEQADAMITSDPLPTVVGDRSQLIQLMQNLIANAIKFRGERSPTVHVTAARSEDAWTFAVQDNGIGIAPEFSERIFVIFQRLHGREE